MTFFSAYGRPEQREKALKDPASSGKWNQGRPKNDEKGERKVMSRTAVQSILVPLSGLTLSSRAVAYGVYAAKRLNVPLVGLYAGKALEDSPTEEILVRSFQKDCNLSGISPSLKKIPDLSADSIYAATGNGEGSLLLVHRKGLDNGQNDAVSFSELATRPTPASLMVIPPQFLEIESMGLVYDGSGESDRALDLAVALSRSAVWPLTILLISEDQSRIADLSRTLEDYFEQNDQDTPIDWVTVALLGPVDETALQFVREGSIELLVLALTGVDQQGRRLFQESPIPVIAAR
jgi:hypothetical protein